MKALAYGVEGHAPTLDGLDATVAASIARQPVALVERDEPVLATAQHAVLAPRLAGVCGSDARLLLGRFTEGDLDNPMAAFTTLPFVLGHEVVADVVEAGASSGVAVGDRVVLDPWLCCAPRGLEPCPACAVGANARCERFMDGGLGPALHVGVAHGTDGCFASRLLAHGSQLHRVPDVVSDTAAVLADPFSVALHGILRAPPPSSGTALVVGAGSLGTATVAALRRLHPDVAVAVLWRYAHQRDAVEHLGATLTVAHEPRDQALEALCAFAGGTARPALQGLGMSYPGGVDVLYDTVGSAETLELGVRVARTGASLVLLGVATPARFEWTPIYFKELSVLGSSGFGREVVDGDARHAMAHYLAWCEDGLDLSWLVTHVEPLERWPVAVAALADPSRSRVLKAALAPQATTG